MGVTQAERYMRHLRVVRAVRVADSAAVGKAEGAKRTCDCGRAQHCFKATDMCGVMATGVWTGDR